MEATVEDRQEAAGVMLKLVPMEMDAGAAVTVTASVTSDPSADMTGRVLRLIDEAGVHWAELSLTEFDGQSNHGSVNFIAPDTPGRHDWTAQLDPGTVPINDSETIAGSDAGESFELTFEVHAHRLEIAVWGMPSAIERGGSFKFLAGLRSSIGSDLSGRQIVIRDEKDRHLATVETGAEPRLGTEALYWAEVTLDAPEIVGRHSWYATASGEGLSCLHDEGSGAVALNIVHPGQHRLRVEVLDAETAAPIPRANVVAHPFRTLTDEAGMAELLLPPGLCTLMVSGPDHFPFRVEGEVKDDMVIHAELDRDVPLAEADIWT